MIDQNKVNTLVGLVQRERITVEQIKDLEYRDAVQQAINSQAVQGA